MRKYLAVLGPVLISLAWASEARADNCTEIDATNIGVYCQVGGTTVSGPAGSALAQFTLPEIDPALGPLVAPVSATFDLLPESCSPFNSCNFEISGMASLDYNPQCISVLGGPCTYREDNYGYGAVLSVTGPNGSFENTGYGSGFVLPSDPSVPQILTVGWGAFFNSNNEIFFGSGWPTGNDALTFTVSVAGTCLYSTNPLIPIQPCAEISSVNAFSYNVTFAYVAAPATVPEPSLLFATALLFGSVLMVRRRRFIRAPRD
ncbi:MAG: PEP-CTERM sorting domain-containing protein [Acidobacteriia bacterium]|nr:PEP-CTERM sorting domain-containing protein [Terriglobia bacterium]